MQNTQVDPKVLSDAYLGTDVKNILQASHGPMSLEEIRHALLQPESPTLYRFIMGSFYKTCTIASTDNIKEVIHSTLIPEKFARQTSSTHYIAIPRI